MNTFHVLLIAFSLSPTFVDAGAVLPHYDDLIATVCLKRLFEQYTSNVVRSALDKDDILTNGEYLGAFCSDYSSKAIDNEIFKKIKQNKTGETISWCLKYDIEHRGFGYIFDQFRENGSPAQDNTTIGSFFDTPILKFIDGLCKPVELIDLDKLKDEPSGVRGSISCFRQCVGKFIKRVEHVVNIAKIETIKILEKKLSEQKNVSKLKKVKISKPAAEFIEKLSENILKKPKYISYFSENVIEIDKQMDLMTKLGKEYLQDYGKVYNDVNQYLTENDRNSNNAAGNLDRNLFVVFSLYQHCAERQCRLKNTDKIPLYTLVQNCATDSVASTSASSVGRIECSNNKKPLVRNFFKALWRGQST